MKDNKGRMHGMTDMDDADDMAMDNAEGGGEPRRPIRFNERELESLARALRRQRREQGPRQADAAWVESPLEEWMSWLDERADLDEERAEPDGFEPDCVDIGDPLPDEVLAALAVGMRETASIRDMMVLSLILDPRIADKSLLMSFVVRPKPVESARRMCALLSDAFDEPLCAPDIGRCRAGVGALLDMGDAMPVAFAVEPMAVAACALWWMGDEAAVPCALECLELDAECSLAAIVFAACNRGIWPAWCAG